MANRRNKRSILDDKRVECRLASRGNDRVLRKTVRRSVPGCFLPDAIPDGLCDKLSDLLAAKRDRGVVGIEAIKLRAKIQRVNTRIVAIKHEKVLLTKENIVLRHHFSFSGRKGHAQALVGVADDCSGLQQDYPIARVQVVGMDFNIMLWNGSSKESHVVSHSF